MISEFFSISIEFKLMHIYLSFFLSLQLLHGYHKLTIPSGQTEVINTDNLPISLFLPPTSNYFLLNLSYIPHKRVVSNTTIISYVPTSSRYIEFWDGNLQFSNGDTKEAIIPYWSIPSEICPDLSYSISADYRLKATATFPEGSKTLCIFPQYYPTQTQVDIIFKHKESSSVLEFYNSQNQKITTCNSDSLCRFKSEEPFFFRFYNIKSHPLSFSISYIISSSPSISTCGIETFSIHLGDNLTQVPTSKINFMTKICQSPTEHILKIVTITALSFSISIIFLMILECFGIINIPYAFGCSSEKSRFGKIKENPYITSIENPVDPETSKEQINN